MFLYKIKIIEYLKKINYINYLKCLGFFNYNFVKLNRSTHALGALF